MGDDVWAGLADQFADKAYASVKGYVRTYVMHRQLLEHLPPPPAHVLDVGGGAGHQSFPLAQAGYEVTLLDSSPAMLDKARQGLQRLPGGAQRRVTLVQADGMNADEATGGQRFAAVLCHGVLGYLEDPEPLVTQLCRCADAGGVVSIMTGNAKARRGAPALVRGMAVCRLARVQRGRARPQRCGPGGGDGRGRTRSQQARPLPPAQPRLSPRGTQRSAATGRAAPCAVSVSDRIVLPCQPFCPLRTRRRPCR